MCFLSGLTLLSEPDFDPLERLISEQDIAEATSECKLIKINEEDEIGIVL